jgi:hypothetical protein
MNLQSYQRLKPGQVYPTWDSLWKFRSNTKGSTGLSEWMVMAAFDEFAG